MDKSIFKNSIFKILLNVFNLIVPIIVGPYVYRKLGSELMGTINYSQAIIAYFLIFASFGVYQYGLREISRVRDDKNKLEIVFTSLFSITIISNLVSMLIYYLMIKSNPTNSSMYIVSIILMFNFISNIFYIEWINEGLENYDFITIKTIIIRIIYVVILFLLVKSSKDYNIYLILLGLSTFLNNFVSFLYVKKKINFRFKSIELKKHIKSMILVVILSNASVLYTQLDKIMIGKYISTTDVAFYTMAQNISYMINALLLSFVHVSIPRLSNYLANNEMKSYNKLLNRISRVYFMFLFPAVMGMFILAKEVILIYGGEEYIKATSLLAIFLVYAIFLGIETILSNQIMYLNNFEKKQVNIVLIGGLLNLIFNCTLVFSGIFSNELILISTIVANIITIFIQQKFIKNKTKIVYKIISVDKVKYFLISLLFIPVALYLKSLNYNMIIYIFLNIIINGLIYFILLILIKDDIVMELINKTKIKLLNK